MATNMKTKPLGKVSSYLKNVGKSIGYASVEALKSDNGYLHNTADLIDTNKELFKDIYGSVKNYKDTIRGIDRSIRNNKTFQTINEIKNSAIEDLKTGQFYNPERDNRMSIESMGDEFADLLKDDWGMSDMDFTSDDATIDQDTFLAQKQAQSFAASNASNAKAIANAIGMGSDYTGEVIKATSKASMAQSSQLQMALSKQLNQSINIMHHDVSRISDFLNKPMVAHLQNSTKFYENTTKLLTEQNAMMRELLDMQRNLYKREQESSYKDSAYRRVGGGVPDLESYFKEVKKNANGLANEYGLDMITGEGMGDGFNPLKILAGQPLAFIPDAIVKFIMPNTLKRSAKKFDRAIGTFFDGMIANLNNYSKKGDNPILQGLAGIFGVKIDEKKKIDTSKFERGNMSWNGLAQKSLVEVIPTYLRRIEGALTGGGERIFDMKSGRWKSTSAVRNDFGDSKRRSVNIGTYEARNYLRDNIGKNTSDEREKQRLYSAVDKLMKIVYNDNGVIKTNDPKKYLRALKEAGAHVSYEDLSAILHILAANRDVVREMPGNVLRQKESYSRELRDAEINGNSWNYIANGSMEGEAGPGSRYSSSGRPVGGNKKSKRTSSAGNNFDSDFEKAKKKASKKKTKRERAAVYKEFGFSDAQAAQLAAENLSSYDDEGFNIEGFNKQFSAGRDKLVDKLLNAGSLGEKWQVLMDSVDKLTQQPAKILTRMLDKADTRMYELLFEGRTGQTDEDGNPIDSVSGVFINQIKKMFSGVNKWINENILKKLKESAFGTRAKQMWDDYGRPIVQRTGSKLGNAGRWAKGNLSDVYHEVTDRFGNKKNKEKPYTLSNGQEYNEYTDYNDVYLNGKANGGYIKKTGMYALSKGEMVVPSESNPFYTGKTDKRKQIQDESKILSEFRKNGSSGGLKGYAEGTKNANKGIFSQFVREVFGTSETKAESDKSFASKVFKNIGKTAGGDKDSRIETVSSGIAGAILGAGGTLLTGLAGGPIIGAALGVGSSLLKRSSFLNELVFGKITKDENGNETRDDSGLIKTKYQNVVKKYAPDMAKYGLAGGVLSLVTPLGMVGGLALGSAFGFAKNNSKFMEYMFGTAEDPDSGLFKKDFQDTVKKHLPAMGKGAIAGGIASLFAPFGVVGGSMIGAGLGLVSTTSTFKDMLLGKEDKKGNRHGGIAGALHDGIVEPLKNSMSDFSKKLNTIFNKVVISPIKSFMEPMAQMIQNVSKDIGSGVKGFMNKMVMKITKKPIDWFMNGLAKWAPRIALGAAGGAAAIATAPVSIPAMLGLGGLKIGGDALRRSQINRGTATHMTAAERIQFRQQHGVGSKIAGALGTDNTRTMDDALASMNEDQLKKISDTKELLDYGEGAGDHHAVESLKSANRDIVDYLKSTPSGSTGGKTEETLYDMFGSRNIKALEEAIRSGDTDQVRVVLNYAGKGGRYLPESHKKAIMKRLDGRVDEIRKFRQRAKNAKKERNNLSKQLTKLTGGMKFKNARDYRYFYENIGTELKDRQKKSAAEINEEEAALDKPQKIIKSSVDKIGENIVNAINKTNNILKSLLNGSAVSGNVADYDDEGQTATQAMVNHRILSNANETAASGSAFNNKNNTSALNTLRNSYPAFPGPGKGNYDPARASEIVKYSSSTPIASSFAVNLMKLEPTRYKEMMKFVKLLSNKGIAVNAKLGKLLLSADSDHLKGFEKVLKSEYKPKNANEAIKILEQFTEDKAKVACKAMKSNTTPNNFDDLYALTDPVNAELNDTTVQNKLRTAARSVDTTVKSTGSGRFGRSRYYGGAGDNKNVIPDQPGTTVSDKASGLIQHFDDGYPFYTTPDGNYADDAQTHEYLAYRSTRESNASMQAKGVGGLFSFFSKFFKGKKNKSDDDEEESSGGILGFFKNLLGKGGGILTSLLDIAAPILAILGINLLGSNKGSKIADTVKGTAKSAAGTAVKAAGRGFLNGLAGFGGSGIASIMNKVSGKLAKSAIKSGGLGSKTVKLAGAGVTKAAGAGEYTFNAGKKVAEATQGAAKGATEKAAGTGLNATGEAIENYIKSSSDDAVENVAKAATKEGGKGVVSKIVSGLKGIFSKVAESAIGSKIIGAVAKATSKETTQAALKTVLDKVADKIGSKALGKVATSGLSKIFSAIGNFSPLAIVLLVTDFLYGWNNADTIFGVAKTNKYSDETYSVGTMQKVIAGLIQILTNRFTLGLIPASILVDIFLEFIAPLFKIDTSKLNAARENAQSVLDAWNEANPNEQYTSIEDYNNKDKWTTKLKKKVSSGWSKVKKTVSSGWNKVKGWFNGGSRSGSTDAYDVMNQAELSAMTVGGARKSRFALKSHNYQEDPSISNMKFAGSTIGKSGCAPVAAANLLGRYGGGRAEVADAASYADSHGYTVNGKGTDINYFSSYLGSKGIQTKQTNSKSNVMSALKNGNQVVMLGRDRKGISSSPFGNSSHFVTATGLDRSGNMVVEDPDLPNKKNVYRPSDVLSSMSSSVIAGRSRRGMGRYGRGTTSTINIDDVLSVAKGEIGNSEKGKSNKCKYNTAFYGRAVSGSNYPWCVVFLWWCFNKAKANTLFCGGAKTASSGELLKYYKSTNQITTTPEPGDIAFFNFSGAATPEHVGIVEEVNGTKIKTIEGNTGGSGRSGETNGGYVKEKIRDPSQVIAYARPAYADAGSYNGSSTNNGSTSFFSQIADLGKNLIKKTWGSDLFTAIFGDDSSSDTTTTSDSDLTGSDNAEKIWNYLKSKGYNNYGIAGIMGNLDAESGLNPKNVQNGTYKKGIGNSEEDELYTSNVDSGSINEAGFSGDSHGYGLAQWTSAARKKRLYNATKASGKSISDLGGQVGYLAQELSEKSYNDKIKNASSVKAASDVILDKFESPKNKGASVQNYRASKGQAYYNKFNSSSSSSTTGAGRDDTYGGSRAADLIRSNGGVRRIGGAGGMTSVTDYSAFLKAIVQVLIQISDDTDKMNKVVELLESQGINLSGTGRDTTVNSGDSNKADAAKSKLKSLLSKDMQTSSNMGSMFANKDTDYILKAMSALASE